MELVLLALVAYFAYEYSKSSPLATGTPNSTPTPSPITGATGPSGGANPGGFSLPSASNTPSGQSNYNPVVINSYGPSLAQNQMMYAAPSAPPPVATGSQISDPLNDYYAQVIASENQAALYKPNDYVAPASNPAAPAFSNQCPAFQQWYSQWMLITGVPKPGAPPAPTC